MNSKTTFRISTAAEQKNYFDHPLKIAIYGVVGVGSCGAVPFTAYVEFSRLFSKFSSRVNSGMFLVLTVCSIVVTA